MQTILRKRVLRDLKTNVFRYVALGILIVLCMYLIVSLVAAAETVIGRGDEIAQTYHLEDGEFTTFVPLTDVWKEEVKKSGVLLEEMFYLDFAEEKDHTLRLFKTREKLNQIVLDSGRLAKKKGEAVIEKRYAGENQLETGDLVRIGGKNLKIVGIGTVPDYDAPFKEISDSSIDSKSFGLVFVTEEQYSILKENESGTRSERYTYAYAKTGKVKDSELKDLLREFDVSPEEVQDPWFQEYWGRTGGKKEKIEEGVDELADGAFNLQDALGRIVENNNSLTNGADAVFASYLKEASDSSAKLYGGTQALKENIRELLDEYFNADIENLTQFLTADDNPRIKASADDQVINKVAGLIAGVIVLLLVSYVIAVFTIHHIEEESSVIGSLYALGLKKKELILHYLTLPVAVTAVSGLIGTLIGFGPWGLDVQIQECYDYFSVPQFAPVYPVYLLIYGILVPPVLTVLVHYVVMNKKLGRPALSLIQKEPKENHIKNIGLGNMGFTGCFRIRQMLREIRSTGAVILGMFISLLILMLGINCYVMCEHISSQSKADTKYEYMYTYKYPEEQIPGGGEAAFAVTLQKENLGYQLDVTLLGLSEDTPYFDVSVPKGESKIILSTAAAQKFGVKEGGRLVLTDKENDRDYAFTVEGITQYSTALYAFMDIDSLRELFGQNENYYNVVFSDRELESPSGCLYAVTSREDIIKSSSIFIDMMMPMIWMLTGVAVFVFFVVMYLMMKVMIDRSSYGISLMKVFGYRTKEVRKLYLNGNFYVIAAGAAICLPLSKKAMDMMYPVMVANVACGMDMSFTWQIYLGIYAGILILYLIIHQLLAGRLKKIMPAEILKDRE